MRKMFRFVIATVFLGVVPALIATDVSAQQPKRPATPPATRPATRPAPRAATTPKLNKNTVVFIGGYFYDPSFGKKPWWTPAQYLFQYEPNFDQRAVVRLTVTPPNTEVYVDGFFAGVVEDFTGGFLDGLPLTAGSHEIVLHLDGYTTVTQWNYFSTGAPFELHSTMQALKEKEASADPKLAPKLPAPPEGSYLAPRGAASVQAEGAPGAETGRRGTR